MTESSNVGAARPSERSHAHVLIDRLDESQITALVSLLQFMLSDPVSRALASAPADDEPESNEEQQAVAEARATYRADSRTTAQDDLLREFGLS